MPSCFALRYKTTGKVAVLQDVDAELCKMLGVPCDDTVWVQNWYNTIGLSLAIGHSLDKIREFFPEKEAIIGYLEDHYTTDSWKEFR